MPKATAKTKHIEHKPELIELLLTEPINLGNRKGNPVLPMDREKPVGFAEKYSSLLYETPNIGSTSKKEFFIHGLLGSILTLPDSELMEKLGIDKVYVKHTMRTEQGSDRKVKVVSDVIKLCFSFKKDGRKQIALRVFVNDEITGDKNPEDKYHYSDDELKEIAKKLDISDIDNIDEHVFRIRTEGDPNNKSFRLHKWQTDGVKERFKAAASSQSQVNNEFKEISVAQSINLEDSFKKLSDEDIKEVMGGTEDIFGRLTEVYEGNQEKFSLGNSEAAYHGFHYGALALNFKYRYDLNCYVERTAGNGRADLIFISRTRKGTNDRMNQKPIPVVVEFKGEGHTADEAIAQIKNKGYLYNLSVRTKAGEAVIVGIGKGGGLKVEKDDIFQSRGFVFQILKETRRFNQNRIDEIKDILEGELKNLYYSIQSHERHYLSKLVLGQVLAVDGNGLDKYIFTYTNQDKSIGREATTFVLSNKAEGKEVVLNIIECSGEQRVPRRKKEFDSKRIPPIDELEINSAVKIDVIINTGVQHKPDGFDTGKEDKRYFHGINVEEIPDVKTRSKYLGGFKEVESINVGNLIEELENTIVVNQDPELTKLKNFLFQFKDLIRLELGLQAVVQGIFTNQITKNAQDIRVYVESNASKGRMDLVLSFTRSRKEHILVMEFKSIRAKVNKQAGNKKVIRVLDRAQEQLSQKYCFLRSLTDSREVKHIAIVFNSVANDKKDIIQMKVKDEVRIPHTSQSESSPEKPSRKRKAPDECGGPSTKRLRDKRETGSSPCLLDINEDNKVDKEKTGIDINYDKFDESKIDNEKLKIYRQGIEGQEKIDQLNELIIEIQQAQALKNFYELSKEVDEKLLPALQNMDEILTEGKNYFERICKINLLRTILPLIADPDLEELLLNNPEKLAQNQDLLNRIFTGIKKVVFEKYKQQKLQYEDFENMESQIDDKISSEEIENIVNQDVDKSALSNYVFRSIGLSLVVSLIGQDTQISADLQTKMYYDALINIGALLHDHENHIKINHNGHEHNVHMNNFKNRVKESRLLAIAHDLYKLHKNIGDVDLSDLKSELVKAKVSLYDGINSEYVANDLFSQFSSEEIENTFDKENLKSFGNGLEVYDKEVITIHSKQVQISNTAIQIEIKDSSGNDKNIMINGIEDIKNPGNFNVDKANLEIQLELQGEKYTVTSELEGENVKFYLEVDGYKAKIGDIISSFTDEEKSNIHNKLNALNDEISLLQSKKAIEEMVELSDFDQDKSINDIKQEFLKLGIRKGTWEQFYKHLGDLNQEVFAKYIDNVRKNLGQRGIEFDRDKFNLAKVKGAKGGKFFSLVVIYDLFDSIQDLKGLDGNLLDTIFGINGLLDATNDMRELLSIQYMRSDSTIGMRLSRNGLGKITSKIPSDVRKGFVRLINNNVVQGITFATLAYQFGYNIDQIVEGENVELNSYFTTSSGIKLVSMGVSFSTRAAISVGVRAVTSMALRGALIATKILGRLSMVTAAIDIAVTIGIEIYKGLEYTKAIAEQVPLLPGDEQAEVFFAKAIKFFTRKDIKEEYENKIGIKGYLTLFKARAIELLDKNPNIAAVVQYANSIIKEEYDEIVRNNKSICNTVSDIQHFPAKTYCIRNCTLKRINEDFSFKEVNSLNSLFLLDLSKTLPLISYTLVMAKWWKEFECEVIKGFYSDKGEECFYKLRNKKAYFIDLSAKHLPHITLSEYNNGLRVVSAPLHLFINSEKYDKNSYAYLSTRCNVREIYMTYKQAFTLSNEPFIFTKLGNNQEGEIVYLSGPKRLTAAANYPAAMHVSKGEVDYTGSRNHNNIFIVNSNTKGILVGGTAGNIVMVNYNATDYIKVDLHRGDILKNGEHIKLHNIYDYISYSTARQDVFDNCKTKYLDVGSEGSGIYSNIIFISDGCQDEDRVLVKVRGRNIYYTGQKQAIFAVSRSSDKAMISNVERDFSIFTGSKNNTDVIHLGDIDIKQIRINEDQIGYSLEFLADDKQSTVISIKSFEKLVIKTEKAGITKVVGVQDKSLFDIVKDMKYQRLNYLGGDVDSKIMEDSKKRSKAVIFADITGSKGSTLYQVAKDIIYNNDLGIPISLVQVKKIEEDAVYEMVVENIYSDKVVADFSRENVSCKKVITVEVKLNGGRCIVKPRQAHKCDRSVDILKVISRLAPYASTSEGIIDLTEYDINPEDVECRARDGYAIRIMFNSYINQGSFRVILDDYLRDPKYQRIIFQFSKGSKFYKVNDANLKFEPVLYNYEKKAKVDYDSFKYYKPDEQGLKIYHNQSEDGNKAGFIDLKDRSILDYDMEIINSSLALHKNNILLAEIKNWSIYSSARKMIFAFSDAIISNSQCIAFTCDPEDIIEEFNKEKEHLNLNKELLINARNSNFNKVEDLIACGADVDSKDEGGKTPLHWTILNDNSEGAIFLISNGANIEIGDMNDHTALHFAALRDNLEVVESLIKNEVNIGARDKYGKTPLQLVEHEERENMVAILKKAQSDLDQKLLTVIKESGDLNEIESFISQGANVDVTNIYGQVPLHWASWNGRLDIVKCLVCKGANINAQDEDGKTPLDMAIVKEHSDVEEYLKGKFKKSNVEQVDKEEKNLGP